MGLKTLNGDQAMAFGALSSGVKLVTSYPGSPSSGTVETMVSLAKKHNIYVEWSSNEKVSLEMPIMEPVSPAEGYAMMREAFNISEEFNTAVIIRETRSFTQQKESVPVSDEPYREVNLGLVREPFRFVSVPKNAVEKHRGLHQRIEAMSEWANSSPFNRVTGAGVKGIVGAGFAHAKLLDVLGHKHPGKFRLFKLGVLYPLPRRTITEFLQDCDEVLIVEEIEPYVETHIKAIAHDNGCPTKIYGKQSNHLSREGELFRWQIQRALTEYIPEFVPRRKYLKEKEAEERPTKKDYCADCNYDKIIDKLEEAAESLGQKQYSRWFEQSRS